MTVESKSSSINQLDMSPISHGQSNLDTDLTDPIRMHIEVIAGIIVGMEALEGADGLVD